MKKIILFPSDYFKISKVEEEYQCEYEEVYKLSDFQIVLYSYDRFVAEGKLILYPEEYEPGLGIYRGWMLKPEQYQLFYNCLMQRGIQLINNPQEYEACHVFKNAYPYLFDKTPRLLYFSKAEEIDWQTVKKTMKRFMIKDDVKSVKGFPFPKFFDSSFCDEELERYIKQFVELRGSLMTGGITVKEYVDLCIRDGISNEYRVFILHNKILSVSPNSNQSKSYPVLPEGLPEQISRLPSNFYTVDFAELANHTWTVIETGDGQVSGLSPNQFVFGFYNNMGRLLNE